MIAFDNLSVIKEWLADALCRIATGGGSSARQLYTDSEEVLFEAMRPVVLNGIPDLATRPDLADRAIILKLPTIHETERRTEAALWAEFDDSSGNILGFLLDAVSTALKRRDDVRLDQIPRMGDFCIWAEAAGPAFGWHPGEFTRAYQDNRDTAISMTVTADVVAETILAMVEEAKEWHGTASELLEKLNLRASDQIKRSDQWPKAPNALSNRLRRAAPGLRAMGLEVIEYDRARPRRWELRRIPLQKTDMTDMTDKTVISDDPDDDVDNLQRHSQFAEQGIGPWRERI